MKFSLYLILFIFVLTSCSGVRDVEVFKSEVELEENEFNADVKTVISELRPIMKWLKWDIAFTSSETGLVTLREAYVYRKKGKLLRIYHYPDKQYLETSTITDYTKKMTELKYGFLHGEIAFTQETMRIIITKIDQSKVRVDMEYLIRTYDEEYKKLHDAQSSGYIEQLILDKLRERLSNSGPRL